MVFECPEIAALAWARTDDFTQSVARDLIAANPLMVDLEAVACAIAQATRPPGVTPHAARINARAAAGLALTGAP